jgi:2-haloacid dehalogenase
MTTEPMTGERWISFDCFGTLIDWRSGYHAILAPLAGARTDALIQAYHEVEHPIEAERPHRLYRAVLTLSVERAAQKIGLTLPPGEADVLARKWRELPLFGDTEAALTALRADGWKIGILTNCDEDLFAQTLDRFPVLRPDLAVTAERVGSYKPELGHFARFERETHVARRNWVHAACSWFHDIVPAQQLGVAGIYVDRDRTGQGAGTNVRVMTDVAHLATVAAELVA